MFATRDGAVTNVAVHDDSLVTDTGSAWATRFPEVLSAYPGIAGSSLPRGGYNDYQHSSRGRSASRLVANDGATGDYMRLVLAKGLAKRPLHRACVEPDERQGSADPRLERGRWQRSGGQNVEARCRSSLRAATPFTTAAARRIRPRREGHLCSPPAGCDPSGGQRPDRPLRWPARRRASRSGCLPGQAPATYAATAGTKAMNPPIVTPKIATHTSTLTWSGTAMSTQAAPMPRNETVSQSWGVHSHRLRRARPVCPHRTRPAPAGTPAPAPGCPRLGRGRGPSGRRGRSSPSLPDHSLGRGERGRRPRYHSDAAGAEVSIALCHGIWRYAGNCRVQSGRHPRRPEAPPGARDGSAWHPVLPELTGQHPVRLRLPYGGGRGAAYGAFRSIILDPADLLPSRGTAVQQTVPTGVAAASSPRHLGVVPPSLGVVPPTSRPAEPITGPPGS